MKCKWVQDRMLLYLAEELARKDVARIVAHLERCEGCAALLEAIAENRDTLRDAVRTTAQPPDSLDARILERVQTLPRRRFPWPLRLPVWETKSVFALAACTVLLLLMGYQWGRSSRPSLPGGTAAMSAAPPRRALDALADLHRAWASPRSTVPLDPEDGKRIAARLSRQTGLRVLPLEIQENDLHLKEGDVLQMKQVPVATLRYDWKGTPVTLVQADGMRLAPPTTLQEMREHGRCFLVRRSGDLTYILWCEGTDNFVLVARVPPPQLFALACQVCETLQRS